MLAFDSMNFILIKIQIIIIYFKKKLIFIYYYNYIILNNLIIKFISLNHMLHQ